jgi:hypothetical protein
VAGIRAKSGRPRGSLRLARFYSGIRAASHQPGPGRIQVRAGTPPAAPTESLRNRESDKPSEMQTSCLKHKVPRRAAFKTGEKAGDAAKCALHNRATPGLLLSNPYSLFFSHLISRRAVHPRNPLIKQAQVHAKLRPVMDEVIENPGAPNVVLGVVDPCLIAGDELPV